MDKTNLIKAPIDNKNVYEDWDWLCDGGNLIEISRVLRKRVVFFENNQCLWKISYYYGDNKFQITCIDYEDELHRKAAFQDIHKKLIESNNGSDLIVDVIAKESECKFYVSYFFKND